MSPPLGQRFYLSRVTGQQRRDETPYTRGETDCETFDCNEQKSSEMLLRRNKPGLSGIIKAAINGSTQLLLIKPGGRD
jgi:hypothetical protein